MKEKQETKENAIFRYQNHERASEGCEKQYVEDLRGFGGRKVHRYGRDSA